MSITQTYTGQARTELGTIAARHGRTAGKVPLTISRRGQPSHHLWLDDKSARDLDAKVVHLCRVEAEGKKYITLRGEVVKDTLTDKITHIDLVEIEEKGQIKVDVAVRVDARNCAGVKAGGLVEQRLRKIKVRCPADAIPDAVEVDLTEVELMQTILVEKIKLPAGVTLVTSAKMPLLSVVIPRGMKAEAEAAAAPAAGAEGAPAADGAAAAKPGDKAAPAAKPGDKAAAKPGDKAAAKPGDKGDKKK